LSKTNRNVVFLFSRAHKKTGSTVMRGKQLADIARKHWPREITVRYADAGRDYSDSDIILTKGALKTLKDEDLDRLVKRDNRLYFDPVDEPVPVGKLPFATGIMAASLCAFDWFSKNSGATPTWLVHHHVDPRVVSRAKHFHHETFRAGYFGEPGNTVRTDLIAQHVDFHNVSTKIQKNSWLSALSRYSLHYAVRKSRDTDQFKPFLKGFTAAACGANMLIQATEAEALKWLGEDYPYLLRGEVAEAQIVEQLVRARDSYGSAEWERALDVMRAMSSKVSAANVADQLKAMFS
jgi:hypothetical protein